MLPMCVLSPSSRMLEEMRIDSAWHEGNKWTLDDWSRSAEESPRRSA